MKEIIVRWFEPVFVSTKYSRDQYVLLAVLVAIGVFLRFWGLGNVGLHGDEETMAMPAIAILETGRPILPSGMFYPRALAQIYLMSGSVWLFGESEWSFRLPSAIIGSLTGLVAFFLGRRFLEPHVNLAFVAAITLLPSMIEISQTARMYVFFVTATLWFGACVFRWERNQYKSSLALALAVWFVCLHFHRLAIFVAPLFFYPGLSRLSWSQFLQGTFAFIICGFGYFAYDRWTSSAYPKSSERPTVTDTEIISAPVEIFASQHTLLLIISILFVSFVSLALVFKFSKHGNRTQILPLALVALGLLAMAILHYHVGGILLLFGIVFWFRSRALPNSWLAAPILVAAGMTLMHLGVLSGLGHYPGRKLIGALVGMPSIWPILKFLEYAPFAGAVCGIVLIHALVKFANGERLPIFFLFLAMAVWAPLIIVGYFKWYVPPRYAQGQIGYFLLCTLAGLYYLISDSRWLRDRLKSSKSQVAIFAVVAVAIINPVSLGRIVNPGYDQYPDHKGAAEYIQSLKLPDDAVLIAEDILQQAYYLKNVQYSLRPIDDAVKFSILQGDNVLDQYTGAIVIGSGSELAALLTKSEEKDLYIIGSGENFVDGVRKLRGNGIAKVLASDRLEVVYEGRDGKTKIWKNRRL